MKKVRWPIHTSLTEKIPLRTYVVGMLALLFVLLIGLGGAHEKLIATYVEQISPTIVDRTGQEIAILPNVKGHFMRPVTSVPPEFVRLLLTKEDKYFFMHPGVNPISILRATYHYTLTHRWEGSSTLTEQLAKTLLGNENDRTVLNKLEEWFATLALEVFESKDEILIMYANVAYFGDRAQGLAEASRTHFGVAPDALDQGQMLSLIATLSDPRYTPGTKENAQKTARLAGRSDVEIALRDTQSTATHRYKRNGSELFELATYTHDCNTLCALTIDSELTGKLREILRSTLSEEFADAGATDGAIVVIRADKERERNEVLALVGSPDPTSTKDGRQIDMTKSGRAAGSTLKPFIYGRAFMKGARPYSQVEDEEVRYPIATGFGLYPKNYDGIYRGIVTLHEALANSLNVPAVHVLEYVGVKDFAEFLTDEAGFTPRYPLADYGLATALGGLDVDLLSLTDLFTIFPNGGKLLPLHVQDGQSFNAPMLQRSATAKQLLDHGATALVTKILSDHAARVDQFGVNGNLDIRDAQYAVKTGTSQDYRDSWTIGYTPDLVVGVWVGRTDGKAMDRVAGSIGAGLVWHRVMDVLLNSEYNTKTAFSFAPIKQVRVGDTSSWGLEGDHEKDVETMRTALLREHLILEPHDGDVILLSPTMTIPLRATKEGTWSLDNVLLAHGDTSSWVPTKPGTYRLRFDADKQTEVITITITDGSVTSPTTR